MKKWTKVLCITAASLIGVGLLFLICGILLGAESGVYLEKGGLKLIKAGEPFTYENLNIEKVQNVYIDVGNAKVELKPSTGNTYGLQVSLSSGENTPDIHTDNGEIRVEQKSKLRLFQIGFNFWELFNPHSNVVTIYVPEKAELSSIKIYTSNGAIETETAFTTRTVDIDTSNGKIDITGLICKEKTQIKTSNGAVHCDGVFDGETNIKTSNGRINASGIYRGEITCKTSNGAIEFQTNLPEKAYNIETETSNGSIRVNDDKVGDDYEKHSQEAEHELKLKTSNGSISVDFLK